MKCSSANCSIKTEPMSVSFVLNFCCIQLLTCDLQVLSGCLVGTQLLEEALTVVPRAARGELTASQGGVLLAVHVVAGLLSLAKVRQLFPLDMSRQDLAQVQWLSPSVATICHRLPPFGNIRRTGSDSSACYFAAVLKHSNSAAASRDERVTSGQKHHLCRAQ